MSLRLIVTAGPHAGREVVFDRHDTFLVGRAADAHLQFSYDDPYFSRRHFLIEVHPPRCRVIDLNSRNGVFVNGTRVESAELKGGEEIRAGHTVFRLESLLPDQPETLDLPAAPEPTCDYRPTSPVPGYRLGEELGRGAMGTVYRAIRESDGLPVAVKTITPAAGVGDRQIERFIREARVMAGLSHPNVVAYHESSSAPPLIYLVMELVDGPNAREFVRGRGQLPVATAVRIVCQFLPGLAHAHARGFVHRDLKPANVLIGGPAGKRVTKVADFGLARAYDDCKLSGLTFQGDVGGTPAFMAPEQATHFRDVRPAADQYSAAGTLYYLLTGAYPHDLPKDIGRQLAHIITHPVVPVASRRADLPAGLVAAVHRAMAREPDDRFPDVAAFRAALLPFA